MMINSKEYSFLVGLLKDIQKKPPLYGEPNAVSITVKYIFHYCLLLQKKQWSSNDTENLWREIGHLLKAENHNLVAGDLDVQYDQIAWVDRRSWGNEEDRIIKHIVLIYQKIWRELKQELRPNHFYKTTSLEVESLLTSETSFVNPDVTAMVYRNLIGFCLDDMGYKLFLEKYVAASQKEHDGDASLGLLKIGLKSDNPPIFDEWNDMYVQIEKMVQKTLTYL